MNGGEDRAPSDVAECVNDPAVVYDRNRDETNTEAVVTAVSSALETDETEMDPIYEVVDPDALDSLFESQDGEIPSDDGRVVFDYESYRVRVESDGTVVVY